MRNPKQNCLEIICLPVPDSSSFEDYPHNDLLTLNFLLKLNAQFNAKSVSLIVDVELNVQESLLSLPRVEIITTTTTTNLETSFSGLCSSAIYISYCDNENDFNCETREVVTNQYLLSDSSSKILGQQWK